MPVCDEETDQCVECLIDTDCDDGQFCNGVETCDRDDGCQAAAFLCASGPFAGDDCDAAEDCWDSQCSRVCTSGVFAWHLCVTSMDCGGAPCEVVCVGGDSHGNSCSSDAQCNDNRRCVQGPACDDGIACTIDSCDEAGDGCMHTPNHATCSDGLYCSGKERCVPGVGCRPGPRPCPPTQCNEATDTCRGGGAPSLRGPKKTGD